MQERAFEQLIPIEFYSKISHIGRIIKNTKLLLKAIEEHQIGIIHTNGSPDNRMALYASWFSRRKFKIAVTKHNSRPAQGQEQF